MAVQTYVLLDDATNECKNIIVWDGVSPWPVPANCTLLIQKSAYNAGTGSMTVTNGSDEVAVSGATFQTDGVEVGRKITFSGSATVFTVQEVVNETTLRLDQQYDGETSSAEDYSIAPISIGDVIP